MNKLLNNILDNYLMRNRKNLVGGLSKKNRINLEWWSYTENLGDYLSTVVYDWILKRNNLDADKKVKKTIHFLAIGSIIGNKYFDATVWGSGVLKKYTINRLIKGRKFVKYDIRAVRGPITKFVLETVGYKCPQIFGDPAILMPLIYNHNVEKKYKVSLICHFRKKDKGINYNREGVHLINVATTDYKTFIDEILASEKVISSSLHGIILSESYGVPCVFFNDAMGEEILKYFDWYFSTGRYDVKFAKTVDESLTMAPMELPNLEEMRNALIDAFPVDLWK